MVAAAALKHYSQYQSSAYINSEGIFPPPGDLISQMTAVSAMKNNEHFTKKDKISDPSYGITDDVLLIKNRDIPKEGFNGEERVLPTGGGSQWII